jgi:hypothetical protein
VHLLNNQVKSFTGGGGGGGGGDYDNFVWTISEVKFFPVLFLTEHHAWRRIGGVGA